MTNERTRAVLTVLAGEASSREVAERFGVAVSEVEGWKALYLDGARSTAARAPLRVPLWAAAATVVALAFVFVPRAWSAPCTAGITCFAAGTPARADEINDNFTQLVTWLQQKVGTVGSSQVTINGNVALNGALAGGNSPHGNLHIDSRASGTDGRLYLNWFDGKGVVVGNGAQAPALSVSTAGTATISGDLIVNNNVTASVSTGAEVTPSSAGAYTYSSCPVGQFVCSIGVGHHGGNTNYWTGMRIQVQCCTL